MSDRGILIRQNISLALLALITVSFSVAVFWVILTGAGEVVPAEVKAEVIQLRVELSAEADERRELRSEVVELRVQVSNMADKIDRLAGD